MWAVGGIHPLDPWGKSRGSQNTHFCYCSLKKLPFELGNFSPPTPPATGPHFVWNHCERWLRTSLFSKPRGGTGSRLEDQGRAEVTRKGLGCVRAEADSSFQDRFLSLMSPKTRLGQEAPSRGRLVSYLLNEFCKVNVGTSFHFQKSTLVECSEHKLRSCPQGHSQVPPLWRPSLPRPAPAVESKSLRNSIVLSNLTVWVPEIVSSWGINQKRRPRAEEGEERQSAHFK